MSVAIVEMETEPVAMGADSVLTVRVVMAAGPLARGAYVVVGAEVVVAVRSFDMRSGVICFGVSGV